MMTMVPDEVIGDIVRRFHAVCKQWRALVNAPCFATAHHRRHPPMPRRPLIAPCFATAHHRRHPPMPRRPLIIRDEGDFQVHGSCDGVLLVSNKSGDYLCNPARRRWARVPSLTSSAIVGFYAHRPSGDFRVLHRTTGSSGYRILTLSRPPTFRRIAGDPHSDELLAAIRLRPASEAPPAIV